ncbi:MAG: MipA/OmpV family protein [Deferrisomatales bacterium]|nr:MipA/OmpV family protein [Deferrisomatales bacterium]
MSKVRKLVLAVLPVAMLGLSSSGLAQVAAVDLQTGEQPPVEKMTLTAGIGAAVVPEFEGSSDFTGAPVLYFRGLWPRGQYVQFLGTTLMGNVLPSKTWQVGPLLRFRGARDDVRNDRVDAMEKVDAAAELGAFAGFQYQHWNAKVDAAQDVANGHEGFLLTLSGGYTLPVGSAASVNLSLSTTYADQDYMQAYFGVSEADADSSELDRYDADAGFKDVSATLLGMYRYTPNWGVMAAARLTSLLGDAADSPIVDSEGSVTQLLVGAAITYTF